MILLFSQKEFEYTTDLVYEWIVHLGGSVLRINGKDLLESKNLKIIFDSHEQLLHFNNIDVNNINVIWYRRWFAFDEKIDDDDKINSFLRREFYGLTQYFFSFFEQEKWYNRHAHNIDFPSKTIQLQAAKKCGFIIPKTIITGNKKHLLDFFESKEFLITKPITDVDSFYNKKKKVIESSFTERITKEYIRETIENNFFPSLFQEEVKKKMELRIFFDKGKCYPMAIISSQNQKTEVDFRQYDHSFPNRNVPFKLYENEENKIKYFMEEIGLETGSLDLIYTLENEFVFLEVNPLGQFGMVSSPCNYYIEKEIAERLIKLDYEKNEK